MGISFMRNCKSCTPTSSTAIAPNPNPGRFKILGIETFGKNVVAKIKYLDCTNFEGVKICVYRNVNADRIIASTMLDPHFAESGLAPFARFTPTKEGELAAIELAKLLN